jgi:hypothetical protein
MPYRPHSEYPSPYPAMVPPAKKRPSLAWFAVGTVLVVIAAVLFGLAVARFVRDIAHADAVFHASGTHQVTLPANAERGLFVREGRPLPRCQVSDGSGSPLQFRRPGEQFTYGDWIAVREFTTGDGNLTFTCPGGGRGQIRIAEVPSGSDFARLGLLGVLLPLGLGGAGFVVLLVTAILWFSRRPSAPPGAPPGPGPPPGSPYGPPSGWSPQGPQPPPAMPPDQGPGQQQPPGTPEWPPDA